MALLISLFLALGRSIPHKARTWARTCGFDGKGHGPVIRPAILTPYWVKFKRRLTRDLRMEQDGRPEATRQRLSTPARIAAEPLAFLSQEQARPAIGTLATPPWVIPPGIPQMNSEVS